MEVSKLSGNFYILEVNLSFKSYIRGGPVPSAYLPLKSMGLYIAGIMDLRISNYIHNRCYACLWILFISIFWQLKLGGQPSTMGVLVPSWPLRVLSSLYLAYCVNSSVTAPCGERTGLSSLQQTQKEHSH